MSNNSHCTGTQHRKYNEKDDNENIPDKASLEEDHDAADLVNGNDWEDFQLDQDDEIPEPGQDDIQDMLNPNESKSLKDC